MAHPRRWRVLYESRQAGVRLETHARVVGIQEFGSDRGAAQRQAPVIAIGDAKGVAYIEGAIHDGFRAAIEL